MRVVEHRSGDNRWYVDEDTGLRLRGVTTIMKDGLPAPALKAWGERTVAEYAVDNWEELAPLKPSEKLARLKKAPFETTSAAGRKGQAIHIYAYRVTKGETVTVPEELKGYVASAAAFMEAFDWQPFTVNGEPTIEVVVYHEKFKYAGKTDGFGTIMLPEIPEYDKIPRDDDGRISVVLDWKTGASGIWGDIAYQMIGYAKATHMQCGGTETPPPHVDMGVGVHLRADGYTPEWITIHDGQMTDFRYIKEIGRIVEDAKEFKRGRLIPPYTNEYRLTKIED